MAAIINIKSLGKNSIYNMVGFGISTLILLIITPYSLNILGKEYFGIWALVSVITTFANLTNFGFDQALIKFIAEAHEHDNIPSIKKFVSTAFYVYLISFGIGCIIIFFSTTLLATYVFKIPAYLWEDFSFVVRGIIIAFFARNVLSVFRSVLLGLQRFDLDNINLIITRIVSAAGVFFFLGNGFGIRGLVYNNYIVSGLAIILQLVFVFLTLRKIPFSLLGFSKEHFRRLFGYSANVFSASVLNMVQDPIVKTAISNLNSLVFVTYYDIGNRIPGMARNFFSSAMDVILPASAVINARREVNGNANFLIMVFRLVIIVCFPAFVIIAVLSKPFITLWLGEGNEEIVKTIYFLLFAQFLSLSATPPVKMFLGIGRPRYLLYDAILQLAVLALLIFPFSKLFDYMGFLISVCLGYVASNIFLNFSIVRTLNIKGSELTRNIPAGVIGISLGLAFFAYGLSRWVGSLSWIGLCSLVIVYFSLYFFLIIKFGMVNSFEKKIYESVGARMRLVRTIKTEK